MSKKRKTSAAETAMLASSPDIVSEQRAQIEALEASIKDYDALGLALVQEFNGTATPPQATGKSLCPRYGEWAINLLRERDRKIDSLRKEREDIRSEVWRRATAEIQRMEQALAMERQRHNETQVKMQEQIDALLDKEDQDVDEITHEVSDVTPDDVAEAASESIGYHIELTGRERAVVAGLIRVLSQ